MNKIPLETIEEFLKVKILPDLEKSRGGFDKIHTLEVVDWLKKIIDHNPDLKLDRVVLVIAAYSHDWGYAGLFKENEVIPFESIENAKKLHMELGAKKIKRLLNDQIFSGLSSKQKERCIHLVAVHDKKFEISETDELVLMEADMLNGMDIDTEKPKRDAEFNKKYMHSLMTTRMPKFITDYGKAEAKKLIARRIEYFENK